MIDLETYRASPLERARTSDLLQILPKGRRTVLDIGARDGHFSKLLTAHFPSVTALDLEKPAFEFPGIVTVAGDVTALDFPDNAFDCVFCTEVLEHIPSLEKACREIVRVARHEIVIGVPFRQDIRIGRATCRQCGKASPPWGHLNAFDEKRLENLFPGLRLVSRSFVGTSRNATTWLATHLMDLAGNPWGVYDEEFCCMHCGAPLLPPSEERTPFARLCSALAYRMNQAQGFWTRPHGNWMHVVFCKY